MKRSAVAVLTLACLAGCGGGSGSGAGTSSSTMAVSSASTAPSAMSVDFTTFTKGLVANQSDTALPVAVSPAEFRFPDDENPQAFATVLAGP